MMLALFTPALAGVLLNEVVYRTSETGTESEWIELCNSGTTDVDLTGYVIEAATSSYGTAYTFTSGTLAPGDHVVVGSGGTYGPLTESLGNSSNTDAIRVKDASGTVVDTLLYGTGNTDNWTDDDGANNRFAPESGDDESIGRGVDCYDTDDSSLDFAVYATPSPGAANPAVGGDTGDSGDSGGGGTDADCTGSDGVVVNELDYTTDAEFVELYNAGAASVTVTGWVVEYGSQSFSSDYTFESGVTIAPGAFLVVGATGAAYKDIEQRLDFGNAGSNADGVRLTCGGAVVDTVIYGESNADGWVDDTGATATSLAPKPSSGKAIARVTDGVDTDASAVDFTAAVATPGASNAGTVVDCSAGDGVVINEFDPNTDVEWVELYNGSGADLDLTGWALEFGGSSWNGRVDLTEGTTLAAGAYYVLGAPGAPYKDLETSMNLGNAGSNADALRIVCGNTTIDTVVYGGEGDANDGSWTQDDGTLASEYAPVPGDGESSARLTDGYDSDNSGDDFALAAPSPGEANPYTEPPVCDAGGWGSLKINEVLYNPDGADGGQDWLELYNAGSDTVILDGGSVQAAKSEWDEQYVFPGGVSLAAGEYLVIGGDEADDADLVGDIDLGTGSEGDGLRIVDCEGTVQDTVLWGDEGGDGLTDDAGSESLVPTVDESSSIGRYPDGADADEITDWNAYAAPTPGAANGDPAGSPDSGEGGKVGTGCGDRPGADRPSGSGCATALPLGGGEVLLAALALVRRRRRG